MLIALCFVPCSAQDHVDIAPSREHMRPSPKSTPRTRKRETLERQEIETGDEFPSSLDNDRLKLVRNVIY